MLQRRGQLHIEPIADKQKKVDILWLLIPNQPTRCDSCAWCKKFKGPRRSILFVIGIQHQDDLAKEKRDLDLGLDSL